MRNGFKVPPHLSMANFDASMGVKTGSEHRTDELQAREQGKTTTSTSSTPANKLGKCTPCPISPRSLFRSDNRT